jgi:stage II sporulation protein E
MNSNGVKKQEVEKTVRVEKRSGVLSGIREATSAVICRAKSFADSIREYNTDGSISDNVQSRVLIILRPAIIALISFLFAKGELAPGVRPMGFALLCACGDYIAAALCGAVLGAAMQGDGFAVSAAAYAAAAALRALAGGYILSGSVADSIAKKQTKKRWLILPRASNSVNIRVIISCVPAVAYGSYYSIISGYTLASLAVALSMCIACPVLTFLYAGAFGGKNVEPRYAEAAIGTVLLSIVFALRGVVILSLNLSVLAGYAITLFVSRTRGWLKGILIGLLAGMTLEAALVPVYAAAGIAAGLLWWLSPFVAVAAGMMTSFSWCVYAGGYTMLLNFMPEMIICSAVIVPLVKVGVIADSKKSSSKASSLPGKALDPAMLLRDEETTDALEGTVQSFSVLSETLGRLSERLKSPSIYDIKQLCYDTCEKYCRRCKIKDACRIRDPEAAEEALCSMAVALSERGYAAVSDIPDYFKRRCTELEKLTEAVSAAYAESVEARLKTDKTEIIAFDYGAMRDVVHDITARREEAGTLDEALSHALRDELKAYGIVSERVAVVGGRRRSVFIYGLHMRGMTAGGDDMREIVSRFCRGVFSSPEFTIDGSEVCATLTEKAQIGVSHAAYTLEKVGSRANGDIAAAFYCRNDKFCALISDGMGSGREAALTSGTCALFIETMMKNGNSAPVTLKMLNAMICARGIECPATIDLLELDLIRGCAKFYKSGAAPTFVRRSDDLYRIKSKTAPIGIIKTLDAERTTFDVKVGDIIVMISDGVVPADNECPWLYTMICADDFTDLSVSARSIAERARRQNAKSDDATVLIVKVTPPSLEETIS